MAIQVKKGVALWGKCLFWVWLSLVVFIFGFSVKTENISEHFYSAGSHCTWPTPLYWYNTQCVLHISVRSFPLITGVASYLRPNLFGQQVCVKIGFCLCGRLRHVICNLLVAESSASVDSHIVWTPVLMPRGQAKNEAAKRWQLSSSESACLEWLFGQC